MYATTKKGQYKYVNRTLNGDNIKGEKDRDVRKTHKEA